MFGIKVCFKERGYWSKAYTYKSETAIDKGAVVVVPTGDFYSIGKVVESVENYDFTGSINYKPIHSVVKV
jgi:hypothetical protein